MNKKTDNRDLFLLEIGKRIHTPVEVVTGDVLGMVYPKSDDVKLKYATHVHTQPTFIKFDDFPYVQFSPSYIGFCISNNLKTGRFKYCEIKTPEHATKTLWTPMQITEGISQEQQEWQKETIEISEPENERAYLIEDETYKNLGKLIHLVELPSMSFMPQSESLEELTYMLEAGKSDIELIRRASKKLKQTFRCL